MDNKRLLVTVRNINQSGYHCAETVSKAVIDHFDPDGGFDPRIATAFGAGIGSTMAGPCGLFTGGLIAIGWLTGREAPGADWQQCGSLAAKWRETFAESFGSCQCPDLIKSLGEQENMDKCKAMGGKAALLLAELLEEPVANTP